MRSRVPLFALLLVVGSFVFPLAAYAGIPFFGPIVPPEVNRCAAGWGAVITVINNIISFLLTLVIVFVAPLMIAYSGFLFVVNPVNSGGIAKAKSVLLNTIIGIIIAFASWLIVDAIMAVLYHPTDPSLAGKAWSQLITSGGQDFCLIQEGALKNLNQTNLGVTGVNALGTATYVSGKAGALCADANPYCNVATLQKAGFSTIAQASAMSCIAITESTGKPDTPDSGTGACGLFQITNKTSKSNWQNPSYHSGNCSTASSCNDPVCNTQTAQIMFSKSGYQPWTGICKNPSGCGLVAYGQPWNAGARNCVNQYDPGQLKD
ncbi:MAG: pilin [bacterium]|nr:pilin [bacterium]